MSLVDVLLITGVVARVTYFVQSDSISQRARDWLSVRARWPIPPLLSCPWCLSVWVAAAVVIVWPSGEAFERFASACFASFTTGFLLTINEG